MGSILYYLGVLAYVSDVNEDNCRFFYFCQSLSMFLEFMYIKLYYSSVTYGSYLEICHHLYSPNITSNAHKWTLIFFIFVVIILVFVVFGFNASYVEEGNIIIDGVLQHYMVCGSPKIYSSVAVGSIISVLMMSFPLYCAIAEKLPLIIYYKVLIFL